MRTCPPNLVGKPRRLPQITSSIASSLIPEVPESIEEALEDNEKLMQQAIQDARRAKRESQQDHAPQAGVGISMPRVAAIDDDAEEEHGEGRPSHGNDGADRILVEMPKYQGEDESDEY